MTAQLLISQPYIPHYRVPFFEGLVRRLSEADITCVIAAGEPDSVQRQRADAVLPSWVVTVPTKRLKVGGRSVTFSTARRAWRHSDAIIVGHVGSSLETYRALIDGRAQHKVVGLWGHIKSYVNPPHPLDAALERWQLNHADQIFAYTPGGTEFAIAQGVQSDRVTTVMNAVDTSALTTAKEAISSDRRSDFSRRHALQHGSTFAYIGGLDRSKRIGFLADALNCLWHTRPEIKVLVGGTGTDTQFLKPAAERGQVVLLGHVDAETKALMASVSTAILMPGRIGLIAVDALALELPILSTNFPFHAPEAEYLREGETRFSSPDAPASYAALIESFVGSAAKVSAPVPSLGAMIENFARGVEIMLSR